jgi:hypothetical protein
MILANAIQMLVLLGASKNDNEKLKQKLKVRLGIRHAKGGCLEHVKEIYEGEQKNEGLKHP